MKLTKMSSDLVTVEIDETSNESLSDREKNLIAKIICPFCSKSITAAHSSARLSSGLPGKPWWNTSNFDSHLKMHHYPSQYHFPDKNDKLVEGNLSNEVLSEYVDQY